MELPFIGFSKEILDMLDGKEAKMVMGGSVQEDFGHVSKLIQKAQKERQKAFGPTYGQIKNFLNPTIPEVSL